MLESLAFQVGLSTRLRLFDTSYVARLTRVLGLVGPERRRNASPPVRHEPGSFSAQPHPDLIRLTARFAQVAHPSITHTRPVFGPLLSLD